MMPTSPPAGPPAADPETDAERRRADSERVELLEHIQALLDPLMVVLGLVFLVLLIVDFAAADLSAGQRAWLTRATTAIWVAFLVDFGIRFLVAPAKLRFLRANVLTVVSLAVPFLRPLAAFRALRALRALRAARSLSLVRLLGGVNRGMRLLRRVTRGQQFAYVAALTVFVVLAGAAGAYFFDRDVPQAPIQTFGDALWWSAALVTTVNSEKYAVSPEARVVAVLQRLFAVSVFGYVTAAIASYFVGREVESRGEGDGKLRAEVADLRREGAALRAELAATRRALDRLAAGRAAPAAGEGRDARSPLAVEPAVGERGTGEPA